jgi:hypothetical protein
MLQNVSILLGKYLRCRIVLKQTKKRFNIFEENIAKTIFQIYAKIKDEIF